MDWNIINSRYVHPAREAAKAGRAGEAERLFQEGLAATHEDRYVALRFAEFLESLERYGEAAPLFELAVRKLPKPEYKQKVKEASTALRPWSAPPLSRRRGNPRASRLRPEDKGQGQRGSTLFDPARALRATARVGLLPCTKYKKSYVCTARELYSESENFRRHLEFADEHYERTFVASAKHGLVALDQLLAPYDFNLDE